MRITVFWDSMPCSLVHMQKILWHPSLMKKIEAAGLSEISLDINQNTWNHIPEYNSLHETCHYENIRKSHGKDPMQNKFHLHISTCGACMRAHAHTYTHTHTHTHIYTQKYISVMRHEALPILFLDLFKILICMKY